MRSDFEATGIEKFNPRRVLGLFRNRKGKKVIIIPSALPSTPSNSRAVRQLKGQLLPLTQNSLTRTLIEKLANAAIGGLTEGYLCQERTLQLEAAIESKVIESKSTRKRTRLTDSRAILGQDLLAKMQQLAIKETPKGPKSRATKRVTFAPKRGRQCPPHSYISLSSSATEDVSDSGDSQDSASTCSTIHVTTPRHFLSESSQSLLPPLSEPPAPTPVATSLSMPKRPIWRTLRPRRNWEKLTKHVFFILYSVAKIQ